MEQISQGKKTVRERKPDVEKENLIVLLANCLKNEGFRYSR